MAYRIRPSSKNSQQTETDKISDRSLVELPPPRTFQSQMNNTLSGPQIRTMAIRLENMENNVVNLQDLWRRQRQISNAGYLDVQKRLDMLEYKAFTNQKDIKQINQQQLANSMTRNSDSMMPDNLRASQNEVLMLKQLLTQQKETQRENAKYQNYQVEQLSMKQMKLEQQMRDLLNKQSQENTYILQEKLQEIKTSDQLKSQKLNSQYELMKNMINASEQKIVSELEKKIRNETIIKDYIEDKISEMREQMAVQQKTIISKQGKFIKEIKQSIEAVFTMAKNIRKQLNSELEETQKLTANNFKKLSMNVDILKDKVNAQLAQLNTETDELRNEVVDLKGYVNQKIEENREMIMEIQEEAVQRTNSRGMKQSNVSKETPRTENIQLEKQFQTWKSLTQQKNLNVFKEISNALKSMKIEWKKENDEITSLISSYQQNLSNVKKSVPLQIKKSIQAIITIFNNQFDTLAQELDTITEMIALSKNQTQKAFKDDLKNMKQEILKEVRALIKTSENEINSSVDRNIKKNEESMKLHIEQEVNFLKNMFSQKHGSLEAQIGQVSSSSKKNHLSTSSQLEDFTLKLKNFNENYKDYLEEQRKDDMKKRMQLEEAMRKNASNLMDIAYKKSEFLVDGMKQAIEMNSLKEKTSLKRQIEVLKEQSEKNMFQMKEQLTTDINQKLDKMAEERESSEQIMHEAFDQQLNTLKKTLSIEIGNSKLELTEKINQLVETLNEMKSQGSDSTEELQASIQSVKQAIWKIEARSFAEQAKNKALMDRFGEDINGVSLNLAVLANQFNAKAT